MYSISAKSLSASKESIVCNPVALSPPFPYSHVCCYWSAVPLCCDWSNALHMWQPHKPAEVVNIAGVIVATAPSIMTSQCETPAAYSARFLYNMKQIECRAGPYCRGRWSKCIGTTHSSRGQGRPGKWDFGISALPTSVWRQTLAAVNADLGTRCPGS